jgi:hypothetical protein
MGKWRYSSAILYFATGRSLSGQLYAPAALTARKNPRYLLDGRLRGLQSRSGRCMAEKSAIPVRNHTQTVKPVAIRLSYPGKFVFIMESNYCT